MSKVEIKAEKFKQRTEKTATASATAKSVRTRNESCWLKQATLWRQRISDAVGQNKYVIAFTIYFRLICKGHTAAFVYKNSNNRKYNGYHSVTCTWFFVWAQATTTNKKHGQLEQQIKTLNASREHLITEYALSTQREREHFNLVVVCMWIICNRFMKRLIYKNTFSWSNQTKKEPNTKKLFTHQTSKTL